MPLTRLVFAGEAIVDLLMRVPALPERGGDMLAESSSVQVGGGFNIMAAAARQDLPVVYAGGHGTGPWGDKVRSALAAEGITLLRPPDPDADTGFDVALVEAGGERTFVTSLGAETLRAPGGWDRLRVGIGDAVYVSGYGLVAPGSGAMLGAWAAGLAAGVLLFADPGPLVADIPEAVLHPVLSRCDWWSCNQREAALLTGSSDPAEAARRLAGRTGRAGVIVRSGRSGCVLARRTAGPDPELSLIPAPAVVAVDTTGAGDAHSGVFLAALAAALPPGAAASRANAAAALAVTRPGPATSPSRAELDAFLAAGGRLLRLDAERHVDDQVPRVHDQVHADRDLAPHGHRNRDRGAGRTQRSGRRRHAHLAARAVDQEVDRAAHRGQDERPAGRLALERGQHQCLRCHLQGALDRRRRR
jgi:sugar/nucleoside kinase (ribokinase family)